MTHKTLKEAYESVGEWPIVGDVIDGARIAEVTNYGETFITFSANLKNRRWIRIKDLLDDAYCNGSIQLKITRDGKQIYPAVEDLDSECKIAFRNLREDLDSCNVPYPATLANSIFNLIDAKIKEAIK